VLEIKNENEEKSNTYFGLLYWIMTPTALPSFCAITSWPLFFAQIKLPTS
jgi:hypothetical protein